MQVVVDTVGTAFAVAAVAQTVVVDTAAAAAVADSNNQIDSAVPY